jgi:nucleotide-binding universal stress UspA family protein
VLERGENVRWRVLHGGAYGSVPELLELVEKERPGLICTYRHLLSDSWQWPYTLGEYVDVLTQVTTTPVLVLPHPHRAVERTIQDTDVVMAMTDHLVGDHALVNWAARFTDEGGRLILANVEDESSFERFMETVGKIPSIDTAEAREHILERLFRDAHDYMGSCARGLAAADVPVTVEEVVRKGHHLGEYQRMVEEHAVDLLVMNTKDEDQLAMHGLAYPLAIEVRSIPLLLL